ncbi:hypothetical protein PC129_g21133 [Phytophthora cactorum]|uniref:RxLR effector protein n=1 Tax=Phytophthora cactorum TaxID=29920 RepID=A0A329RFT0_9STRA|nr:hypothetical protein Pcac1_g22376 [Phytophthora cactorum]KAG2797238.1 hypothetical protein PC111_g21377 [Phytophthora cactorum]KAG2821543.1 hypothetical protein PC112_g11329 [Phytophthora cactorum]KAG2845110.1 hypothetical protein PC113_g18259 [Phytophthora cactorum]KAG2890058.1 hypothetical protein PC115_g19573 [Phytophthora cactorum]
MRLSFMGFVTMAIVYFAICNATLDSDQTKVSTVGSPDLVLPLGVGQIDNASMKRYLRTHKRNGGSETEERVLGQLMIQIKYMIENVNLRGMLKEILDELLKADDAFRTWEALRYNAHGADEILNLRSPRRG